VNPRHSALRRTAGILVLSVLVTPAAEAQFKLAPGVARDTAARIAPRVALGFEWEHDTVRIEDGRTWQRSTSLSVDVPLIWDARANPDPSEAQFSFGVERDLGRLDAARDTAVDIDAPATSRGARHGILALTIDLGGSTDQATAEQIVTAGVGVAYENLRARGALALIPSVSVEFAANRPIASAAREGVGAPLDLEQRVDGELFWTFSLADDRDAAPFRPVRLSATVAGFWIDAPELAAADLSLREGADGTVVVELAPPRSFRRVRVMELGLRHGRTPSHPEVLTSISLGFVLCRETCR
jgi:hypothetical protein